MTSKVKKEYTLAGEEGFEPSIHRIKTFRGYLGRGYLNPVGRESFGITLHLKAF
jgi:hypothetical protein